MAHPNFSAASGCTAWTTLSALKPGLSSAGKSEPEKIKKKLLPFRRQSYSPASCILLPGKGYPLMTGLQKPPLRSIRNADNAVPLYFPDSGEFCLCCPMLDTVPARDGEHHIILLIAKNIRQAVFSCRKQNKFGRHGTHSLENTGEERPNP